jgi:hypothetical protein
MGVGSSSRYATTSPTDGTGNYGLFGKVFVNFTGFPGTVTENKAFANNNTTDTTYVLPPPPISQNMISPYVNTSIYLAYNTNANSGSTGTNKLLLVEDVSGTFKYTEEYLNGNYSTSQSIIVKGIRYRNGKYFYFLNYSVGVSLGRMVIRYDESARNMQIIDNTTNAFANSSWLYTEY